MRVDEETSRINCDELRGNDQGFMVKGLSLRLKALWRDKKGLRVKGRGSKDPRIRVRVDC